jgi:GDPmannose 4,6-dehydratase
LAEFLLLKGYRVVGTTTGRNADRERIVPPQKGLETVQVDLLDQSLLEDILHKYKPDEVYNLAARASSTELWLQPVLTGEVNALGVTRLLDAIHIVDRNVRFIQASSSEVFGNAREVPQTEVTPLHPRNPYGVAKAYGHWATVVYREQCGLFACSCILYNHESPRRGLEFISRKISNSVARIKMGQLEELRLGNLDAKRDWGFAGDYIRAMWLILQQAKPDDYVVATGEVHSVREMCEIAFSHVGLNYQDYVVQDGENFRSFDTALLVGNPEKAQRLLGWKPTVMFPELVRMMVDADLESIQSVAEQRTSAPSPMRQ